MRIQQTVSNQSLVATALLKGVIGIAAFLGLCYLLTFVVSQAEKGANNDDESIYQSKKVKLSAPNQITFEELTIPENTKNSPSTFSLKNTTPQNTLTLPSGGITPGTTYPVIGYPSLTGATPPLAGTPNFSNTLITPGSNSTTPGTMTQPYSPYSGFPLPQPQGVN
ncbi:MAG: hypothetical protein KME06_10080 [Kastovskya adunca ATA6-11-RM4]|jgi:hypothetical protein|nr:hypothetical protein [Kastovskya adunca ATA6-11-RM4]